MIEEPRASAILGASGYIGQHFARLLADHPWFGAPILLGSPRSAGRKLRDVWQLAEDPPPDLANRRIELAGPGALRRRGVEVVFSALPSGTARAVEAECRRRGIGVFSNAADHRMDPGVPLLIPEVNGDHLSVLGTPGRRAPLVTNPNCTATGLSLVLAPLLPLLRPRWVGVATYQALSGAGYPGVPSLNVTDNVVPFIPEEEEKVGRETDRILGVRAGGRIRPLALPVMAQCARVAVREGHLEAVTLLASRGRTRREIVAAFRGFDPLGTLDLPSAPHPPVVHRSEPDRPQPLRDRWAGHPTRARGMAAVVGRIRVDRRYVRFFVLSHNAVRGGAGGSILNAEYAVRQGYLPKKRKPARP